MTDEKVDPAVEAAWERARRAEARAEFLEQRADLFEGVTDEAITALWDRQLGTNPTISRRSTT